MGGKGDSVRRRITFDAETWHGLDRLAKDGMSTLQELADEAFRDLHVDEGIDHPDRVLLADVINRVRQQRRLPPIRSFDEPPHPILPHSLAGNLQCFAKTARFSHRLV
jgi:hypothetical protein